MRIIDTSLLYKWLNRIWFHVISLHSRSKSSGKKISYQHNPSMFELIMSYVHRCHRCLFAVPSFATTLNSNDLQESGLPSNSGWNHRRNLTISWGCRHCSLYFTIFQSNISIQLAVQDTQKHRRKCYTLKSELNENCIISQP